MKPSYHFQGKASFSTQDFRNAPASAEQGFQVFASHAELIHPKLDRFDWIWRADGVVLRFIGFNEGSEHVQFVPALGARLRIHEMLDATQGAIIISCCLDRSNRHNTSASSIVLDVHAGLD